MNERIKQLALDALFESDFDDEQNIKITMDMFAEKIIKECAKIADDNYSLGIPTGQIMKQYFGVSDE